MSVARRLVRLASLLLALALPASAARASAAAPFADPPLRTAVLQALDALYAFHPTDAGAARAEIARRWPGHPVVPLLAAEQAWWRTLADPRSRAADAPLLRDVDAALVAAERRAQASPDDADALWVRASAYGLRSRLRALRGDWLGSALDAGRARASLAELQRRGAADGDLLLGLGLYDYFAAAMPHRYPALRPLAALLPAGDRARGLARLARASREGTLSRVEATWFLLQIHYGFERDYPAALAEVRALRRAYPDNPVFDRFEGRVSARLGR